MTGLLQTVFFFGYSALACLALSVMTGTIGAAASGWFVRSIYLSISSKLS